MSEARKNVWAGLITLAGLTIVGILIVLFGWNSLWFMPGGGNTINVLFDEAAGIRPGTRAVVAGVPVGRVRHLDFADPDSLEGGVIVEVTLHKGRRLRAGSWARASAPEVGRGRPPIDIFPGPSDAAFLESGSVIRGETRSAMASLLPPELVSAAERSTAQFGELSGALVPVLADIHGLLAPRTPAAVDRVGGPPGNLASAVARLDAALKHVNDLLGDGEVQSQLRESVRNYHAASAQGKQVVADAAHLIAKANEAVTGSANLLARSEETLTSFDGRITEATHELNRSLDLVASVFGHLDPAAAKIGRGEGTLGKMINDDQLYEALLLTLRRLAEGKE